MKFVFRAEHFVRITVVVFLIAFAVSCKQEQDPAPEQTTAQFTESTLTVLENEGERLITLSLDRPAVVDGQITLLVNTLVPHSFVTTPLAVNGKVLLTVSKGQTTVHFKIIPADNPSLDGCKVVNFSISSLSDGLLPGSLRDVTVSVNDDEAPAGASFEFDELNIRENDPNAAGINIRLTHPAPAQGILVVRLQSTSKYGTDYTTEPAAIGGKIFLQVADGATLATIKVFPVNDATFRVDRNISFNLVDGNGGVVVGEENSLRCAITEDDGYALSTIFSIRSRYEGEPGIIHNDTYIEGTVTSISNLSTGRIVVEDGTAALQIQFIVPHSLTRGDIVLINLNSGMLRNQPGGLEVSQVSGFEKLGERELMINKMTMEELFDRAPELLSQTIELTDVQFPEADGALEMLGDRIVTDGVRNIIVRTNNLADFGGEVVPEGPVDITGIFVASGGAYYLYPQDYTDIKRQLNMLKPVRPRR